MIVHNDYLSDEELRQLIGEAENDMVPAPLQLKEKIVSEVFKKGTDREFAMYCFRVSISVAAAVLLVFMTSDLPEFDKEPGVVIEESTAKEGVWVNISEAFVSDYWDAQMVQEYPTREEVLNDTDFAWDVFNENDFFEEKDNMTN